MKDVQKLLKFDPNNTELLAQKQKLLNDQIVNTSSKLNQLKAAEAQVQAQFDKGDLKGEQYRAFQRELQDTEQSLRYLQGSLQDTQSAQDDTQRSAKQLQDLFRVTGKSAQDYADILGSKLVRSIQDGTAGSRDLQKAFEKVGADAIGAKGDIQGLRTQIDQIGSGAKSVQKVREEIKKLGEDANNAGDSLGGIAGKLGGAAVGAVGAVGGLKGIVDKAMASADLQAKINMTMEIPEESQQAVKDSISKLVSYGEDEAVALEAVRRQYALNGEAGDAANQKIIKSAGAIAKAYDGIDLVELIQESDEFGAEIGLTQQKALEMQNALLKMGFPPEQLDIMSEYGGQLKRAGYSASEIQGVFAAGIKTKSWNIDVLLDGLKEGRIGLAEMGIGIDDATAKIIQGTGISKEQLQGWGKDVAAGGKEGKDAMMEVALALTGIDNEAKRNEVGVKLFGTLWEEQGSKITDTLLNAKTNAGDLTKNTQEMNNSISTIDSSPMVMVNDALSNMNTALQPVYTMIADLVAKIAEWVAKNPELAATITAVIVGIGLITAAIVAWSAAQLVLDAALLPIIATVAAIVIGIALLVAAIIYVKNHMEGWKKKAAEMKDAIGKRFTELKENAVNKIQELWKKITDIWNKLTGFFKGKSLMQIGKDIIQGLINGIGSMAGALWKKATSLASSIGKAIQSKMKAKSPSRVTMGIGEDVGEGLEIGLGNTMKQIQSMSKKLAVATVPRIPKEKTEIKPTNTTTPGKTFTVNIHSPKALDIKESNKLFQRTLNNMSLLW